MLKILGGTLILAAAGAVCLQRIRARRRELTVLNGLAAALEEMESGIRVSRLPLPRLLKKAGCGRGADLASFFDGTARALKSGEPLLTVWETGAEKLPLSQRDRVLLRETGRSLCGDEQQACRGLEQACRQLRRSLLEKQQEQRDLEKRTTAVCFSGAALLIILLM